MELKDYQQGVLTKFNYYLSTLRGQEEKIAAAQAVLKEQGLSIDLGDPCVKAWDQLNDERRLPYLRDDEGNERVAPYLTRLDGLNRPIPNVTFKVPTGGGKTLLATAAVEIIQVDFFRRQTGFVLWVVPSDAIYKQTWKQLANREHPYRQMLERASGGRVKMLEKGDAFTKQDAESYLCVMLLMLPSAARQSKETLRMFRDSGKFTSFFPIEDDALANKALLERVPNLDVNDLLEGKATGADALKWVSLKHSLGNVLRLLRPLVVVDEGHKAYSATARNTLDGFNPKFILELSATPNAGGKHACNVLVSVPGTDLKNEEMIKLPIDIVNEDKGGWKHTLTQAHQKLDELQEDAAKVQAEENRYIRPILLVRVERTGKEQRDSGLVHSEDAKEYLIDKLGAKPEQIRVKTSEEDTLGDEDLKQPTCEVRYIITKAALQEGWDCPFAYVLAVLSKTTANTALTQMIGRILRQPDTRLTGKPSLNKCYVFTFDQEVTEAVKSVRNGLQEEGMADLASQVTMTSSGSAKKATKKETLLRRGKFGKIPPIFLPRVLHQDSTAPDDVRELDYERDILGELDWESFRFLGAHGMTLEEDEKAMRTLARINMQSSQEGPSVTEELFQEQMADMPEEGLDVPFLVRQLLDVIPNPWQGMRILGETLEVLRSRGLTEERLYTNRLGLIRDMKLDLRKQVHEAAERLFREKLEKGCILFRLVSTNDPKLNWKLAETLSVDLAEDEPMLKRKNGDPLERSLFEKVFRKDFNELEKETAWYLDGKDCVHWWHRIAVGQGSYGLQGWQKHRVYPDFLACIHGTKDGKFRFSVLETKGDHLKGNDDTAYKQKLFDLLTEYSAKAVRAGELVLGSQPQQMNFTMLMEDSWRDRIETCFSST
ncbi:MAG: DEAD/DEAH box helicase family protein [Verrucomicrobiaceae bacterium]|nr:DEAD/DEAH box helicase family protein [Verrucomicrobiaceae bacterium]